MLCSLNCGKEKKKLVYLMERLDGVLETGDNNEKCEHIAFKSF